MALLHLVSEEFLLVYLNWKNFWTAPRVHATCSVLALLRKRCVAIIFVKGSIELILVARITRVASDLSLCVGLFGSGSYLR